MTCRYSAEPEFPTRKAADAGAEARKRELEAEFQGRIRQPWYPFPCPDGNHWHLALSPQGPAI